MKKLFTLIIAMAGILGYAFAQTTTTFTIDANGEGATIDNYNPGGNYPNEIEFASRAWTINSIPTVWRSVFKFDLSCIPSGAVVESASLSLFYPAQNNFFNQLQESLTSSNESVVQRITTSWTANTVTWNNQPSSTSADQVILPQSTSGTQDYTHLDVTAMVQQMISTANNGFLLKLTNEVYYANMLFASGHNPDSTKHPQLVVTYTVPGINCLTLRLDAGGEDNTIDDYNPAGNYPSEIELASRAWTINSIPVVWRSLFKFDFPCAMSGSVIQSAYLNMYYPTQNGFGNQLQESLTSSNESVIQRITSPWSENTVTWNNQPSFTTTDQVILPQSTSGTQDYTSLDVTAMVQEMVTSGNYGFLIKLTNEVYYANMLLASGDNPDSSKHPTLELCYSFSSGVGELNGENSFSIFPNPAHSYVDLAGKIKSGHVTILLTDILGQTVISKETTGAELNNVYRLNLPATIVRGIYFITILGDSGSRTQKLIVE